MKRFLFAVWRGAAGLTRRSRRSNLRRLRAHGQALESCTLREATAADLPALARVHVTAWNATYAPLLVVGPGVDVRERQWREAFERRDPGWFCFVMVSPDGTLVGFAQANRSDHPGFGGELNKIYLLPEFQRLGLGGRLLQAVCSRFRSQGINSMWLCGDARNPSAGAWVALGAEKLDSDPGTGNYGWRDLRLLDSALRRRRV